MNSQSRIKSIQEVIINVGSGFVVNWTASFAIFPLFGIESTFNKNTGITLIYTVLALVRSYLVRRFFNRSK